jgi:hypothetical protein
MRAKEKRGRSIDRARMIPLVGQGDETWDVEQNTGQSHRRAVKLITAVGVLEIIRKIRPAQFIEHRLPVPILKPGARSLDPRLPFGVSLGRWRHRQDRDARGPCQDGGQENCQSVRVPNSGDQVCLDPIFWKVTVHLQERSFDNTLLSLIRASKIPGFLNKPETDDLLIRDEKQLDFSSMGRK